MPCLCQLPMVSGEGSPSFSPTEPALHLPCACLSERELGAVVHATFCLSSTGECLPVVATAVCHDSAGQLPSRALAFLNEAPHRVQGTADLEGEHGTACATAPGPVCWAERPPCTIP